MQKREACHANPRRSEPNLERKAHRYNRWRGWSNCDSYRVAMLRDCEGRGCVFWELNKPERVTVVETVLKDV